MASYGCSSSHVPKLHELEATAQHPTGRVPSVGGQWFNVTAFRAQNCPWPSHTVLTSGAGRARRLPPGSDLDLDPDLHLQPHVLRPLPQPPGIAPWLFDALFCPPVHPSHVEKLYFSAS